MLAEVFAGGRNGQNEAIWGQPGTWMVRLTYPEYLTLAGGGMSLLKRLLRLGSEPPKQRIRVCIECGMPVAEHKDWCSILRGQIAMQLRAEEDARNRRE